MTSHAAVVARGMGKCCVAGCNELMIDYTNKTMTVRGQVYHEGDFITIDGGFGEVYEGQIAVKDPEMSSDFNVIMGWAQKYKKMMIKTNAEEPREINIALDFGAQGIGLCRTEHMFFEEKRIKVFREMIVAETFEQRQKALDKLEPL